MFSIYFTFLHHPQILRNRRKTLNLQFGSLISCNYQNHSIHMSAMLKRREGVQVVKLLKLDGKHKKYDNKRVIFCHSKNFY